MNPFVIDFESSESKVLLNPRLPPDLHSKIEQNLAKIQLQGHIWLTTSGTNVTPKLVALSKEALLHSGRAVNRHFAICSRDTWLNILPCFHVGGLGIHARCYCSGAQLRDYSHLKWDPQAYCQLLETHRATWSSLVPAQIFDLISLCLKPPKSLRGIIVGGGAFSEKLHAKAHELGWPLFPSYGMTECSSQIATAQQERPNSPLIALDHVELRINGHEWIEIKGPSLLTAYLNFDGENLVLSDPKKEGWYCSEDRGSLSKNQLRVFGRGSHFLKIGGESVDFSDLEKIWEELMVERALKFDSLLIDMPDERLGNVVHLAVAGAEEIQLEFMIKSFNRRVLPIAKIRGVHFISEIPRSPLKKVLKQELRNLIIS